MNNFGWASVGFLVGIAVALSWSNVRESQLVREASSAERDGRTINNQMMPIFYPKTYRTGNPQYLERDFEAGADLICDEIESRFYKDMCSKDGIGWR